MSAWESTILVTGGTMGLGFEAARIIARECPRNVLYLRLDLGDLDSVRKFAQHLHKRPKLAALLMNAGIHTPLESGTALARLAISPDAEKTNSGKYFEGLHAIESSKDSYNETKQEELWNWTAKYLGRQIRFTIYLHPARFAESRL